MRRGRTGPFGFARGAGKLHGWIGETLDSPPGVDRRCREREERAVLPGPSALRLPGGPGTVPPGSGDSAPSPAGAASQRLIAALLSALTLRSAIRVLHHQQTRPVPVSRSCWAAASSSPRPSIPCPPPAAPRSALPGRPAPSRPPSRSWERALLLVLPIQLNVSIKRPALQQTCSCFRLLRRPNAVLLLWGFALPYIGCPVQRSLSTPSVHSIHPLLCPIHPSIISVCLSHPSVCPVHPSLSPEPSQDSRQQAADQGKYFCACIRAFLLLLRRVHLCSALAAPGHPQPGAHPGGGHQVLNPMHPRPPLCTCAWGLWGRGGEKQWHEDLGTSALVLALAEGHVVLPSFSFWDFRPHWDLGCGDSSATMRAALPAPVLTAFGREGDGKQSRRQPYLCGCIAA